MGGWIKLEKDLYTDPRIRRLARLLGERDRRSREDATPSSQWYQSLAVGAVSILWITADSHVDENDVLALGPADIDELTGIQGICELLPADWLEVVDAYNVKLPGFHAHNGTAAKKRAVDQKRQQSTRHAQKLQEADKSSRSKATK